MKVEVKIFTYKFDEEGLPCNAKEQTLEQADLHAHLGKNNRKFVLITNKIGNYEFLIGGPGSDKDLHRDILQAYELTHNEGVAEVYGGGFICFKTNENYGFCALISGESMQYGKIKLVEFSENDSATLMKEPNFHHFISLLSIELKCLVHHECGIVAVPSNIEIKKFYSAKNLDVKLLILA